MADELPQNNDLTKLVPAGLLRRIRAHFRDAVDEAVARYRFNQADEDSLTGALGHAFSLPERIVSVLGGTRYSFAVESHKILGKGPGTPEKRVGADGIFQVSVWEGERRIFEKGLPFQAKKKTRYRPAEALKQAADLLRTSETGIILRYGEDDYDAADVRQMLRPNLPEQLPTQPGFASLGSVLGDWFLKCQIGRVGLSFDEDVTDPSAPSRRGTWVISTDIHKRPKGNPSESE